MKQSSKEKMIFEDAIEMAYVEDIMKHLGMGISEGFMDDIAEIFSRGCALNKMQAWGFLKVTMLIVEDITTQKLTEKIEFRYLKLGCYSYLDMDKSVAHALKTIQGMRLSAGNLPHQKNLDFL